MNEVNQFGMQTIDTIKELVVANRYMQALVILYSAIDTLAWVSLEAGDVTGLDFCKWVDTYIFPEESIGCTSTDLYAARCGIVHSYTAESKLSRNSQAKELWYVTASTSAERIQEYAHSIGSNAHIVPFTLLVAAFIDGVMNFSDALAKNAELEGRCVERMKKWIHFVGMPPSKIP